MKQYIACLLFLCSSFLAAQNFEDTWKGFFSYVSVKAISKSSEKVYVAAENSVFTYDLITREIETISTINGLSGEEISSIYYSEGFGVLVVGYENGLLDVIVDDEEGILNIVDIFEKPTIPPDRKTINDFFEFDGNLYISTDFGISLFDLQRLEFGDTYFIGDLGAQVIITQTTVLEPYIYASSSVFGVKRAMVNDDNLIDFAQWETISTGSISGIQTLGDEIYIARANNSVALYDEGVGFTTIETLSSRIRDFRTVDDVLSITQAGSIRAYGLGYNLESVVNNTLPDFDFQLQSGISFGNTFYLGTINDGLLIVPFGTTQVTQALPDGPILNKPFALDTSPGQLWVTFGEVDANNNPFTPNPSQFGISNLREEAWTNIPYEQLESLSSDNNPTDFVNVIINPNDPNEVYMCSFLGGLLRINDQTPDAFLDETNSNLEEVLFPAPNPNDPPRNAGIRLYGADYDSQGSLWVTQALSNDAILRQTGPNQFQKVDISDFLDPLGDQAFIDMKISREGFVFMSSANNGVVGYNPATGAFNKITEGDGNGNLPNKNSRAIALDRQNRLWIGTKRGLRVLFNVGGFFEEGGTVEAQEIIILDNGVPQELLFQQTITDIQVDGSNNKWIATATSGVFYLSPNGQETLLRFTKDNSPLPSNNVQDIAIDEVTGRVYFATVNGLVAFEGTSTAPQDDLENVYAFPNPVRPGFTGNVTIDGLTARANVKITDIEGNLVFETTSQGGSVQWDTKAFGQYKVASGVYVVMITTDDALETKVSKIMIVR